MNGYAYNHHHQPPAYHGTNNTNPLPPNTPQGVACAKPGNNSPIQHPCQTAGSIGGSPPTCTAATAHVGPCTCHVQARKSRSCTSHEQYACIWHCTIRATGGAHGSRVVVELGMCVGGDGAHMLYTLCTLPPTYPTHKTNHRQPPRAAQTVTRTLSGHLDL